jgi:protein-disulfide isomerase
MANRFPAKFLVIFTAISCLVTLSLILFVNWNANPLPIPLYTEGQPTIGSPNAKVHVVVFEDPECNSCILYHNQNYKKLYNSYIEPGLIRYTIYFVTGLPDSSLVTKFLLCAANQSPDSFFTLLDNYYINPPLAATDKELIQELLRLTNKSIPTKTLTSCLSSKAIQNKVNTNTDYARIIMGGVITTPTVFVNGIQLTRPSYKELTTLIQKELKK